MNKSWKMRAFGVLALAGAGVGLAGCNFTPDLSKTAAQTMIQAEYDKKPAEGFLIAVGPTGLQQGLDAGYWKLTKVYPSQRWADYTLTPEGKKVLVLNGGGDVIQWRPDSDGKAHFFITTIQKNHARIHDVQDPQDDVVANVDTAKSTTFMESVNWTDIPQPLQDIAHNPGNTLSTRRHVDFALEGGTWKVHLIR